MRCPCCGTEIEVCDSKGNPFILSEKEFELIMFLRKKNKSAEGTIYLLKIIDEVFNKE